MFVHVTMLHSVLSALRVFALSEQNYALSAIVLVLSSVPVFINFVSRLFAAKRDD